MQQRVILSSREDGLNLEPTATNTAPKPPGFSRPSGRLKPSSEEQRLQRWEQERTPQKHTCTSTKGQQEPTRSSGTQQQKDMGSNPSLAGLLAPHSDRCAASQRKRFSAPWGCMRAADTYICIHRSTGTPRTVLGGGSTHQHMHVTTAQLLGARRTSRGTRHTPHLLQGTVDSVENRRQSPTPQTAAQLAADRLQRKHPVGFRGPCQPGPQTWPMDRPTG